MAEESTSRVRAFSSPELAHSSANVPERPEDYSLEGIATNIKLLLKLVQDHSDASTRSNDDRKPQRVAGMMTILDDVKSRIEKHQSFNARRKAAFRRCNTELRPNHPMNDKKPTDLITDEKEKLRKQLSASLAAQKSLEKMISSLGKEKKIMASELARKVGESNEMEELISNLKSQNENLLGKLQSCAKEHKEKKSSSSGDVQGNAAHQERNKALSEQLLRSLEGYRYLKRKYKDLKKENAALHTTMEEMGVEVMSGLQRLYSLKQMIGKGNDQAVDIEGDISALEHTFKSLNMKMSKG